MKTKKCKYCCSEIDAKAKVCPVCRRKIAGAPGCLIAIVVVLAVFVFAIAFMLSRQQSIQKQISGVHDSSEYITLDEYNQIQSGMSYEEVVNIIGSPGTSSVESSTAGYEIVIYTWYGNGVAGSNANVTFTNGQVSAKAQVGLQ